MSELLCPVEPPPELRAATSRQRNWRVPEHIALEFTEVVVIIPDRLYFATAPRKLAKAVKRRFATLNTDDILVYEPFFRDFGPLNLGYVWRFADEFESIMKDTTANSELVYYADHSTLGKVENAAFLLGCYLIDMLDWTAEEVIEPFLRLKKHKLVPFRDASYGSCTYELSLYACFLGFQKARKLGWYTNSKFNLAQYEKYEQVCNGDLNWIIPGKFVAFSGPASPDEPEVEESYNHPPERYIPIFKKWGIKLVIRLNKKQYNAKAFTKHGIKHLDLYFVDGSCPSESIIKKFLSICEEEPGAIAVHCKAGLGRTGTLIGCYAIRHHNFRAHEWIAWNRIIRPGSVLGPQQHFLHLMEGSAWLCNQPPPPAESKVSEKGAEATAAESSPATTDQSNGTPTILNDLSDITPKPIHESSAINWHDQGGAPLKLTDGEKPAIALLGEPKIGLSPTVTPKMHLPPLVGKAETPQGSVTGLENQSAASPLVTLSPQDYRVAHEGDSGQGERLVSAKMKKTMLPGANDTPSTSRGTTKSSATTTPGSPRRRLPKSTASPRAHLVQRITDFFSPRKPTASAERPPLTN